ncbi:hypothetical protein BH11MYX1_BH11MYX1_45490 [soil metagenome]
MRVAPDHVALALAAFTTFAHADTSAADEAFKQGRELLKAGKFAQACEQFETSQELDPAFGTLYNIAQCDAEIGKLAEAIAAYKEVLTRDPNITRRQAASEAVGKLEPRVPRLIVKPEAGVTLELDGQPITAGTPILVDVGKHKLVASKGGKRGPVTQVKVRDEGKTVSITAALPAEEGDAELRTSGAEKLTQPDLTVNAPIQVGAPATTPQGLWETRRKEIAIGTIAVGGAALATGLVFGALASSNWNDAKALCNGTTTCSNQLLADQAAALGSSAQVNATTSTIFVIAGIGIATAGVVIYATAPSKEHQLAVTAMPSLDGGSFALSGKF